MARPLHQLELAIYSYYKLKKLHAANIISILYKKLPPTQVQV